MRGLPAFCPRCGNFFEDTAEVFVNVTDIDRTGTTSCPVCNGRAEFLSGSYSVIGDQIELLKGSKLASSVVDDLNRVRSQIAKTGVVTDDIIEILDVVNPAIGKIARFVKDKKYGSAILMTALAVALAKCATAPSQPSITVVNNVYNINSVTLTYGHDAKEEQKRRSANAASNGPNAEGGKHEAGRDEPSN